MLYGVEVLSLSEKAIERLEQEHRSFGKRIQHLPDSTPNPLAYSSLGWSSIHSYIAKQTLEFIYNISLLKCDCLYKEVWLCRLIDILHNVDNGHKFTTNSPIKWFVKACLTHNLLDKVKDTLSTGMPLSKNEWKTQVKTKVQMRERVLIMIQREMYSDLGCTTIDIRLDIWWEVAFIHPKSLYACRLMVKLKLGMAPLQNNLYHTQGDSATKTCLLCKGGTEDTTHFIFLCPKLPRKSLQNALVNVFDNNASNIRDSHSTKDGQGCTEPT